MSEKEFLWGAATASAQIEGGWDEDGRTPSIWDVAGKDKIRNGESCHKASDHYHHYKEDVALMKEIGLKSYRFSISWSRICPKEGVINPKGLQFYSDLVDELLKAGITPLVTLYHWDLPTWVMDYGGWESEKIIPLFLDYVKAVVDTLSDRVRYWITFNEPQCFLTMGYMMGVHAPFLHHTLTFPKYSKIFFEANAKAVKLIRETAKTKPIIGLAFATSSFIPEEENSEESIEKARRKTFYGKLGSMNNRWWMDPIFLGKPVTACGIYRNRGKKVEEYHCDMDFIGINHYQAFNYQGKKTETTLPRNSLGWVIDERSIYWTIRFVYERYHLPIMITENGVCFDEQLDQEGEIKDDIRSKALDNFIFYMKKAEKEGIPVLGYHYWSLMDNFEWAEGYQPRFGLIYVDYKTEKRTLKQSAYHYRDIIRENTTKKD